jgi:hypothetical protein
MLVMCVYVYVRRWIRCVRVCVCVCARVRVYVELPFVMTELDYVLY